MLTGLVILIAEDQALLALDLAEEVEAQGGTALGPVPTAADGVALADRTRASGAILDANLLDGGVTPLALHLIAQNVPIVIHTGTGVPPALAEIHPGLPVVMKPASPAIVLRALGAEMLKAEMRSERRSSQEGTRLDESGGPG